MHFLPPHLVVEHWMADAPVDDRCHEFDDYLLENYMTASARFPSNLWAEEPSQNKRTNNAAESFHAHFNEQFYNGHPMIFVFIDVLKWILWNMLSYLDTDSVRAQIYEHAYLF